MMLHHRAILLCQLPLRALVLSFFFANRVFARSKSLPTPVCSCQFFLCLSCSSLFFIFMLFFPGLGAIRIEIFQPAYLEHVFGKNTMSAVLQTSTHSDVPLRKLSFSRIVVSWHPSCHITAACAVGTAHVECFCDRTSIATSS
jgi:hypothetical protein